MKDKYETTQNFKNFYSMIQTQFDTKIKIFRTDNGREYFNHVLGSFLAEKGILYQSSCIVTPQQNGIAERMFIKVPNFFDGMQFLLHVI